MFGITSDLLTKMPNAFLLLKTCHLLPLRFSIPIVNKAFQSQPLKALLQTKHGNGRYYMVGHTRYAIGLCFNSTNVLDTLRSLSYSP